jgi:hypothetical protein
VSGVLHGSPLPLSLIDRGVLAALAVVALIRDDDVTRAVVGELAARLVSASSDAEVYAATLEAVLYASGVLEVGMRA